MGWKYAGCTVQGNGHQRHGIPCQDKIVHLDFGAVHVAALADGAGSAVHSEDGARQVVEVITGYLAEHFCALIEEEDAKKAKEEILNMLLRELDAVARDCGCKRADLASTLLAVAVREDAYLMLHIGDGVIGYVKDGKLRVASSPDNGEFSNETTFVTSPQALRHFRIFKGRLDGISGFVLMSDGSGESLYLRREQRLIPALKRVMHQSLLLDPTFFARQLEETMRTQIAERTMDDCSIVFLARQSNDFPTLKNMEAKQRMEIYGIEPTCSRTAKRQLRLFDKVYAWLESPRTAKEIFRHFHWHHGGKKKLVRMLLTGLIVQKDGFFHNV